MNPFSACSGPMLRTLAACCVAMLVARADPPVGVRPPPDPRDFACAHSFRGQPAPVDLGSHPDARTFRAQLREQARRPADFAGYYVAASWGCGSPCQRWALIDQRDGKVYFAPFTTAVGARFSLASRLFVADAPEDIAAYEAASSPAPTPGDSIFATTYWEWDEVRKEFRQLH